MDAKQAAETLLKAWTHGMGTFDSSPVAAVWHDGTQMDLCTWREFSAAVLSLCVEHRVLVPVDEVLGDLGGSDG